MATNQKVWLVVRDGDSEGQLTADMENHEPGASGVIDGVFSTREAAERRRAELQAQPGQVPYFVWEEPVFDD